MTLVISSPPLQSRYARISGKKTGRRVELASRKAPPLAAIPSLSSPFHGDSRANVYKWIDIGTILSPQRLKCPPSSIPFESLLLSLLLPSFLRSFVRRRIIRPSFSPPLPFPPVRYFRINLPRSRAPLCQPWRSGPSRSCPRSRARGSSRNGRSPSRWWLSCAARSPADSSSRKPRGRS